MGIEKGLLLGVQRKTQELWLDEFNDYLLIRELSASEAEKARELAVAAVDQNDVKDMMALSEFEAYLVECGVIATDGSQMLSRSDVETLRNASYSLFSQISTAIATLSNIGNRKAAVDNAKKNLKRIR